MKNKPQLRICYLGWGFHIHLRRWMKWFLKAGHEIQLITESASELQGVVEYDIWSDHTARRVEAWSKKMHFNLINIIYNYYIALRIKKIIKKINPDIVHVHTLYIPFVLGSLAGFHPTVITPWNGDIVSILPGRTRWQKLLVNYGIKYADLITVDSLDMKNKCIKAGKLPQESCSKIKNIQWGINRRTFHPNIDVSDLKKEIDPSVESFIVLSARQFQPWYNIDIIVRSIPLVLREIPNVEFVFIWHAESILQSLKELAEKLGVREKTHFLGSVPDYNDLAKYYAMADVSVSVSSFDTTPVSMWETIACGTPLVVGDIPSLREWIEDDYNGLIVPLKDYKSTARAIVKLLKDETKRKLFVERNLELVKEKADHNTEMKKVEQLYYSLLSNEFKVDNSNTRSDYILNDPHRIV